jgi:hypothetical protein
MNKNSWGLVLSIGIAVVGCKKEETGPTPEELAQKRELDEMYKQGIAAAEGRDKALAERWKTVKGLLRDKQPKKEAELITILGEPNETTQLPAYRMLTWVWDAPTGKREVIVASIDKDGKVAALQY